MRRLCRMTRGEITMLSTVAASSGWTIVGISELASQQQRQQREAEFPALRYHHAGAHRLEPAAGRGFRDQRDHGRS